MPRTPVVAHLGKVIFTARSTIADDSAQHHRAQISKPLRRGTAANYSTS
jgi:hypothetical protein